MKARRIISILILAFALSLIAYGIFSISRSAYYQGMYYDESMVVFDNGLFSFIFGVLFLLLAQAFRFYFRQQTMLVAASSGLVVFAWKRLTIPDHIPKGMELFPDAEILNALIITCLIILALLAADRFIQRLIDFAVIRPYKLAICKLTKPHHDLKK